MRVALILGAAVWPDGPSPTLRRRTLHAADLWRDGRVQHLVPCGGVGRHPPSEAATMRDLLLSAGVPADAITLEDRSTTTLENVLNARPLVADLGATAVVLVTDATHAPRARMTARALGLPAVASSSPPLRGSHRRQTLRSALRECAAIPGYWWQLRRLRR